MDFIIYALVDSDGIPRYVGQSSTGMKRPRESRVEKTGTAKSRWLKTLSTPPEIVVLEECVAVGDLNVAERKWIKKHRSTLCNQTDGGDGSPGRVWTEEQRRRLARNNNRTVGKAGRAAISRANKGRKWSPEILKRRGVAISKAKMGHKQSDETKRKISVSKMGQRHTEETRRKMSEAHKERWRQKKLESL